MGRPTKTQQGLGWRHQQVRARLIFHHTDGTPCWWCGRPMFREKELNWDSRPLAADHTKARHHGGLDADRLLHFTCNSQRQEGDRDHLRPALRGRGVREFEWGKLAEA